MRETRGSIPPTETAPLTGGGSPTCRQRCVSLFSGVDHEDRRLVERFVRDVESGHDASISGPDYMWLAFHAQSQQSSNASRGVIITLLLVALAVLMFASIGISGAMYFHDQNYHNTTRSLI